MWGGKDKLWTHYTKGILAADIASGRFMLGFMRMQSIHRAYLDVLEVADLQKYKVIKSPKKIKTYIIERANIPFVFFYCKN